MMSVNIKVFETQYKDVVSELWSRGFRTTSDVLEKTATRDDRRKLAAEIGADEKLVNELARRSDLARIKGIGNLYAELLKHANITCAQELADTEAESLYEQMLVHNRQFRVARRMPKIESVTEWVRVAKKLDPVIEH